MVFVNFKLFFSYNINLISQKKGLHKNNQISDINFIYNEGPIFISKKNQMIWNY